MVAPRIFRVSRDSVTIGFFNAFFFKRISINSASGNLICFLHRLDVAPKTGPRSKKGVLKRKKTTLKLEERDMEMSFDQNFCIIG